MVVRLFTRREALVTGAGILMCASPQKAVAAIPPVIIALAFRVIGAVIRAVLIAALELIVEFVADGIRRVVRAVLNSTQHEALRNGGSLVLRDARGNEREISYSVEC